MMLGIAAKSSIEGAHDAADPGRGQLHQEEGDGQAQGHGNDHGDEGGDQGADDAAGRPEFLEHRVPFLWKRKSAKPNCLIAGQEERIKSSPMASITSGTSSEQKKVSQRKVRSPPGAVLTWRPLTTVSGAGGTSSGPFGWTGLSIMGYLYRGQERRANSPRLPWLFLFGVG